MKTVYIGYIHMLYGYFFEFEEEWIYEKFDIDSPVDRVAFFLDARARYEKWGPITRTRIREALEYILCVDDIKKYWRAVLPHELPLFVESDKRKYVQELYCALMGHEPPDCTPCIEEVEELFSMPREYRMHD